MRNFEKHFVVMIAISIILLANTVNATFNPKPLLKTQTTRGFSSTENSFQNAKSNSSAFLPFEKPADQRSKNDFLDFGLFSASSEEKGKGFNDFGSYSDFVFDEDSVELVIGIKRNYDNLIDLVGRFGGEIVNTVSIKGEVIAIVVDVPLNAVSMLKNEVQTSKLVRYVEPNMKFHAQFVPNDPFWSVQWGLRKIEADWAWNTTVGNSSVLVAVIDSGIDYTHPDLAANYVSLGRDWVNNDADPLDDFGHGTHCAGIIAAVLNNSIGIAGVAQVRIMAEKGLDKYGSGTEDDLANAIIHAVNQGAKILSNSWGGYGESYLIHDAVQYAYNHGVLVIAAAGNEGWSRKPIPAGYKEVVAVTATDQYDKPASFTNFGDWVEVAAPGVNIYSTMPTYHVTLNDYGYSTHYSYMSGTSMACPHAAGVAALIWSQFPNANRDWVRAQLRYKAEDLGDPGFDKYYGYGRVNAKNAVEQAPPEHDILIFDWSRPQYVKLGESNIFNITVFNFGANNETYVEVQLLVNDTVIDSTSIDFLSKYNSTTVSLSWTPIAQGIHNVTFYVVPVSDETIIANNQISETLYVVTPPSEANWMLLETDPDEGEGTNLKSIYGQASSDIIYLKVEHHRYWTTISDIDTAIFIDADQDASTGLPDGYYPYQDTDIGADYVIVVGWEATEMWRWDPIYEKWDTSDPISLAYLEAPEGSKTFVVGVFFADVETSGIVDCAVSDIPSDWDWMPNSGYFTWILIHYEHELAVLLKNPIYLQPGETSLLNATVCNYGLTNETNVEIHLFINETEAANVTLGELINGTCYTLTYAWTPTEEGIYNITAYAPPVSNENFTLNNVVTRMVNVHYPLINPQPGQYANYVINYYDSSGHLTGLQAYLNLIYDYYIEPNKIYIRYLQEIPNEGIVEGWMIVNTMTRFVEDGVWAGLWYPGWIETDINIGSTINLLYSTATVNGSRMKTFGARAIDCWEIPYFYVYLYTFWHDKASGLWIGMDVLDLRTGRRSELLLIDTNVPIGTSYEHDLGVTLDTPQRLQPGETSLLNATVYNVGLSNESNVEIQLLINGTVVKSETITELVNGTSFTINYSWTPTTEGIYNITAYAPPVTDENVIVNNVATYMVQVRFIQVALISSYSDLTIITPILDSMGIGYDIYNNNNAYLYTENLNLLLKYKAVIFYNRHRRITSTEYLVLESYLSSDGNLLVTGYDCLLSDTLLAQLVRSSSIGDDIGEPDLIVVDETHPIMDGPYGSFPRGYYVHDLYYDCDSAEADITRGAITVAELLDGYDRIIATEGLPGKVVFWNGEGTYDWTQSDICQAMFKNLIHWFLIRYQHELVVSLQAPKYIEPGDSAKLNATVRNAGLNDEINVELQLLINGTIMESETIALLENGSSHTISYLWTPPMAGKYNITVYAPPVQGENITANNVYSKILPVQCAPKILAYVQYTDYYYDYQNTIRAIESAFGPNYNITELWDYTQLDLMLPEKDILLIPDQERADIYTMELIGTAWSRTLTEFLGNGGILILCDGRSGYGGTYGILTGAGIMSILDANYRSYYTLYLVDPTDPLAEGVSSSFVAPYYTVSFSTQETNVVINDGVYPVVIRKEFGRGQVALLGFDFENSNPNSERILGNAIDLATYITISISPLSGSPGTEVTVSGTKATANGTISIYWDDTFIGNTTADSVGNFQCVLIVPLEASVGVHQIMAVDAATQRTALASFRVILIILNPSRGSIGTKVTIEGVGFTPEAQARITFNDMLIGYVSIDSFGNFTFTFNIPFSTAETQLIKAYDSEGYASATFTVVDITPLDVQMDVGVVHFKGEIAEFYSQIVFKGVAVNATNLTAILYGPNGETVGYSYPENITLIATGLYKTLYNIPMTAGTGTYTLVVTAQYFTETIQACGTSFKSFLISDILTLMNNQITEIREGIATVQTDLGFVKLNLTAMNLTLENIFLHVIAINGTTATIQTTLGIVNGTITGTLSGDVATIVVPGLGQIQTDISNLKGTQETWVIPQYFIIAMALLAAISSTLSLIFLIRRKKA